MHLSTVSSAITLHFVHSLNKTNHSCVFSSKHSISLLSPWTMSQTLRIPLAAASSSISPTTKPSSWDLSKPLSPSCFFGSVPVSPYSVSWVRCCARENTASGPVVSALWQEGSLQESPVSLQLQSILSETQFDRIIAEAQQFEEPVVLVWVATWCRKCIYLKPKLEKLAADYYPRLRFYSIDVNTVPHKLVARAGVTKMPTIQLWKDGRKLAEVIGGHKAYLVINEVQEMIENECSS